MGDVGDKPPGKGTGEAAEAGDEKYQNERLANIESWIAGQDPGFTVPEQTYGADAAVGEPDTGGTV